MECLNLDVHQTRCLDGICSDLHKIANNQMTLRDQFALSVLDGLLSCDRTTGSVWNFVNKAYQVADTMLEARKQSNEITKNS